MVSYDRSHPIQVFSLAKTLISIKPNSNSYVQLLRSVIVSIVALVFDFFTLVFLKEVLSINYLVSAAIGFTVGVTVNYLISVFWVFSERKMVSRAKEFAVFIIICSIGLVLNLIVIGGLVEFLEVDYKTAKVASTVLVFFWNFIMRKKILY